MAINSNNIMLSAAETNLSEDIQRLKREMSSQMLITGVDEKGATY